MRIMIKRMLWLPAKQLGGIKVVILVDRRNDLVRRLHEQRYQRVAPVVVNNPQGNNITVEKKAIRIARERLLWLLAKQLGGGKLCY